MGIKIKHSPSAAAIGESAYTIGRGEKKRWATDIALKQQALGLQARSVDIQGMSVALRAKAQAAALEQREEESERLHGLREEESERLHGLREEELEFRKQQQEEEMGLELQARVEATKRYNEENTILAYTPKQEKLLEHYDNLQATAEQEFAQGRWTPKQMEEITAKTKRLKGLVILQKRRRSEMTPEEMYRSNLFTETDGSEVYVNPNNGQRTVLGSSEESFNKQFAIDYKAVTETNFGLAPTAEQMKEYAKLRGEIYNHFQSLATQTKEEKARLQQKAVQDLQAMESMEKKAQAERRGIIAALPNAFDRIIKGQPKSKGLKKGVLAEKTYSEEDYKNTLAVATEQYSDIPPDIIKDEFDKWRAERQDVPETPEELRKGGTREDYNRGVELGYWE